MDMSKYQDIFVAESRENIINLNRALLEFEKDTSLLEPLEEVFRAMHSIKGMAGAMGFDDLADFAHSTEDIMDQMRKREVEPRTEIIDLLFTAFDALDHFVEQLARGEPLETNFLSLKDQIEALVYAQPVTSDKPDASPVINALPTAAEPELTTTNGSQFDVTVFIDKDCQMKGVRTFIVLKTLRDMGKILQCIPPESDLELENFGYSFQVFLQTSKQKNDIEQAVLKVFEIENVQVKDIREQQDAKTKTAPERQKKAAAPQKTQSVRVAIEHLDNLMNLVEELVLNRGRLSRATKVFGDAQISGTIEQLARLTTNLRDEVMLARMVPASEIFDRYPRLVRDTSKELGKQVELHIEGGDIELDRTVLDQINDPLVHILRNAIDHGIEMPDKRRGAGKPEHGTIQIRVSRERSSVIIAIEDDGKGLDPAFLKQKAIEKGVLTPEEASQITDEDAYMIITRPGFSTAATITDVSGRGVGMDVVRTRIRSLGGSLTITSTIGAGSQFGLSLPLTLAIIQGLEVNAFGEIYVIPLTNIVETMELYPADIQTIRQEEVTILRGEVVPLVRLDDVLEVPNVDRSKYKELAAVIVEVGTRRRGLVVSKLIGQNEIVVKPLRGIINAVNMFTGVTILGDGRPAFILDVGSLS